MNVEKNEKTTSNLEIADLNSITFELSDADMEAIKGGQVVKLSEQELSAVEFVACNAAFTACNAAFTACNAAFTACNAAFTACNAAFSQ